MASRKGKRIGRPQPMGIMTAGTVLLLGWHMHALLNDIPRERVASYPPQTLPPAPAAAPGVRAGAVSPVLKPPAAAPAFPEAAGPKLAEKPAPSPPPLLPPGPLPASGNLAPVHGPVWQHAPLPAFSPELLQAMMDPRAARRARHLRRLGIALPAEPASALPASGQPAPPAIPDSRKVKRGETTPPGAAPAAESGGSHTSPVNGTAGADHGTGRRIARLELPGPDRTDPPGGSPAAAITDAAKPAPAKAATGAESGTGDSNPAGESGKKETAAVTPPAGGPPVRLQARLEPPRSAYRAGEWVALRFMASRPVHLRVYRVDAAGRVTRVFSTYSREEAGSPARTFSMMVKAGEPKPGPEGMIAIGSARPLTHDELLSCLRASLAEAPAGASVPAPSAAAAAAPAAPTSPADALQAVIDAVGRAADTPEASPAPLDRSGWSVAIGQFTSAARKLSDAPPPPSAGRQSALEKPGSPAAARHRTL